MSTPYEKIYENALSKFRSYEIPQMSDEEAKDFLKGFLIPAISEFHVCRKDLSDRDEESECFNADLSDIEIDILGGFMVHKYIEATYINTPTLLKVNLSSSDFNAYSPANMLDKLNQKQAECMSNNEKLLSRYAWSGLRDKGIKSSLLSTVYDKTKYSEM